MFYFFQGAVFLNLIYEATRMCRDRSPKEVLTLLSLVHGEVPGRNVPIHHLGEKKLDVLGMIYGYLW